MRNKRVLQILALVVVLSMIFTSAVFATPGHKKFKRNSKQYELNIEEYDNALKSLIEKEIVKGYGKGDYGLSGNVKRGDVIVMIVRAFQLEDDYDVEELSENFLDIVDKDHYFYAPVGIAKKLGIAKGDGKYFKPNKPVTIQEAIWLIERSDDLVNKNIDEDTIDELEEIYKDELNDFAKRRDVFWMLYYVLDGTVTDDGKVEETELTEIKIDMNDDSELAFLDSWFNRVFNNLKDDDDDVEDLEYVEFELPIDNGTLYYDYDEDDDKNTLVNEDTKYYIATEADDDDKEIKDITLVPKDNFSGTISIKYYAFDLEGASYEGLLKITVERNEDLDDIKYTVKENNTLRFDYRSFESYIDEVVFTLLDEKVGTLYFDDDKDGKLEDDEEILKNEAITRSDLRYVYFVPYQDIKDEITINYVAYDGDDELEGRVIVTIESVQEIPTLSLEKRLRDESVEIDFEDNLYESIGRDLYNEIDYAKFALPSKGQLMIKYDGNDYKSVVKDTKYYIDDIEAIKYIFDVRGTVDINYTVYDEDTTIEDKAYDGLITIEVTR